MQLGQDDIENLDDFEEALDKLATGDTAPLRYVTIDNPQNIVVRTFDMDRIWFPVRRCSRDDATGVWPCRNLSEGPAPKPPAVGSTRFNPYDDPRARAIAPSLVVVTFDLPYTVSGVSDRHYYGTGLVVDAERGYVVVDRNTVPVAIGDVSVTFAGSLEVDAEVVQLHPLHNLAIVAYDPATIGDTPVKAAAFNTKPLRPGDPVWVVGMKADHQLVHQESTVASVDPLILPLSRTLQFRDSNIEGIDLVNAPRELDGVLVDKRGRVAAMWSTFPMPAGGDVAQFNRGVSADLVAEFVQRYQAAYPDTQMRVPGNVFYNGYMATRELLQAIERAGSTNNIAVIKQLEGHKMKAADRMQHHDAWIDPDTHQVQQTVYLATANTETADKDDLFKILTQSEPEVVRDTDAPGACKLESYADTPTFDA